MKSFGLVVLSLASSLLWSGCPEPTGDPGPNPPKLFLATDGSELKLRLLPVEPDPF